MRGLNHRIQQPVHRPPAPPQEQSWTTGKWQRLQVENQNKEKYVYILYAFACLWYSFTAYAEFHRCYFRYWWYEYDMYILHIISLYGHWKFLGTCRMFYSTCFILSWLLIQSVIWSVCVSFDIVIIRVFYVYIGSVSRITSLGNLE